MTDQRPYRGLTKEGKWVKGWYNETENGSYIFPFEVIPETVSQSTGRKDKNDTEIFAGDKIQDSTGDIGEVYWKENVAGFYCRWGDESNMPLNTGVATKECEVIGTIHDHLLAKGASNE